MKIEIHKFGDILVGRPAGREALNIIVSYLHPVSSEEVMELDFSGVKVMAPSWLDEVYTGLVNRFGNQRIKVLPSTNESILKSFEIILEK